MPLKPFVLCLILSSPFLLASETDLPDLDEALNQQEAVMTLKPDEKVTIITRKVTQIKVPITEGPKQLSRPSWRCKDIPDEAFIKMGGYGKKIGITRSQWEKKAVFFVLAYGPQCPSFAAMEKQLPPNLSEAKYTDILSAIYELNVKADKGTLTKIARETEKEAAQIDFEKKHKKNQVSNKQLEKFSKHFDYLERRVRAAREILNQKYAEETKERTQARDFLGQFISSYLKNQKKSQKLASMKATVKSLNEKQKERLKTYVTEVLGRSEYPLANLLPANTQGNRKPAAESEKDLNLQAALQVLIWELTEESSTKLTASGR